MTSSASPERLDEWYEALAAPVPAPAAGSATAITAALAASVVRLVAGLTLAREALSSAHTDAAVVASRALALQQALDRLAHDDAGALERFLAALALPRGTEDERDRRTRARTAALAEAAAVQRAVLGHSAEVAELAGRVLELGPRTAAGDAATAVFLAAAASRSAYWAAREGVEGTERAEESEAELTALLERAQTQERAVLARLSGAHG